MRIRHFAAIAASAGLLGLFDPASAQMFSKGNGLVDESARALDREQFSRGRALAQRAIDSNELSPQNVPAAYNNLCIGLNGIGQYDEAMEACNRALKMRPRQWSFYNNRANIHFSRGHYSEALSDYYKAMTFSPGDDVLLSNISLALRHRKMYGDRVQQASADAG